MTSMKGLALLALALPGGAYAIGQASYVEHASRPGSFPLAQAETCATLYVDSRDYPGVVRAAADLQADVARVTGCTPAITHDDRALLVTSNLGLVRIALDNVAK